MMPWVLLLLHLACVLFAAPTLEDLLRQQAAIRLGRAPPPMDQTWRDILRLLRKPALRPAGSGALFAIAPATTLGTALAATLLVPSFTTGLATAPIADLVVVAALLACSRLAPVLAALDAGSAQTAAAAMPIAAARLPTDPLLFLAALLVAMLAGTTSLDPTSLRDGLAALRFPSLLAGIVLLAALASEPAAPAVFSGRDLALVSLARQLRRIAALSVVAVVALPLGLAPAGAGPDVWLVGFIAWAVKLLALALLAQLLARHRAALPAAALLALIAALLLEAQPAP